MNHLSIEHLSKISSVREPQTNRPRVFIVHGHDVAAKEQVARFVQQLGLEPVILHEQPNFGRSIIEKLELNSNVDFVVVLLTPDDLGKRASTDDEFSSRARQNVWFELGYFIGKLGRHRVCALHKHPVEILSDYFGVIYIPIDTGDSWRLALARELKAASMPINTEALFA